MSKDINIKKTPALPIMLVDDDELTLHSYELLLLDSGYDNYISCSSAEAAFKILPNQDVALVILDLSMPGMGGMKMLEKLSEDYPQIPAAVVTANQEIETAVGCMKSGAFDFLVKPVEAQPLLNVINHAIEIRCLRYENMRLNDSMLSNKLKNPECFSRIISASPQMRSIFLYIESIAVTSQPVLITGETGVGKELIAGAVHQASGRKGKLVTLNVAGLDDMNFSDTLFGHKSGAYTDAKQKRHGLIEAAQDGTIFLDEIGDLKESSQVKLLRLIQQKEYYPLGSDDLVKSNARIITATNHDLNDLIADGNFRKDLYYRLKLHHIHVSPLRERPEDIEPLADYFMVEACRELEKEPPRIEPKFYELLKQYSFPGNVRELQAIIFESLTFARNGQVSLDIIKSLLNNSSSSNIFQAMSNDIVKTYIPMSTLEETESIMIDKAIEASDGNLSQAAKLLGVSRSTLYRKLNRK